MKHYLDAKPVAILGLLLATLLWGLSFPLGRALLLFESTKATGFEPWLLATGTVALRFLIAAVLLSPWVLRMAQPTKREWQQGLGLGVFGGLGMLFQMEGLAHTDASTSAFLTQSYCFLLPLWTAFVARKWPKPSVYLSLVCVLWGVQILSGFDFEKLSMGRGETATLIASLLFAFQIIWLERPVFSENRSVMSTFLMFICVAAGLGVVALGSEPSVPAWVDVFSAPAAFGGLVVLALLSTLGAFFLMNHFQKRVTASEAGIVYSIESVWASLAALFLPAWLSQWFRISYPNEALSAELISGGILILIGNVVLFSPILFPSKNRVP